MNQYLLMEESRKKGVFANTSLYYEGDTPQAAAEWYFNTNPRTSRVLVCGDGGCCHLFKKVESVVTVELA